MSRQVFFNLPLADLAKSTAFFKALGFAQNPQLVDDSGACFSISDAILVMLLMHARFRDFTPEAIRDTSRRTSASCIRIALSTRMAMAGDSCT